MTRTKQHRTNANTRCHSISLFALPPPSRLCMSFSSALTMASSLLLPLAPPPPPPPVLLHRHSLMSTLAAVWTRLRHGLRSFTVLPSLSRQALCRAWDSPRRHCVEQLLHDDQGAQLEPGPIRIRRFISILVKI